MGMRSGRDSQAALCSTLAVPLRPFILTRYHFPILASILDIPPPHASTNVCIRVWLVRQPNLLCFTNINLQHLQEIALFLGSSVFFWSLDTLHT